MKISKSNQDPKQINSDREQLKNLMSKKSSHFSIGTAVVCNNMRGMIYGFSKTTGIKDLEVHWADGTKSDIPNPRYPYIKWS